MTKDTKSGVIIKVIMVDGSECYIGDFEKYDGQYMDNIRDAHVFKSKKMASNFLRKMQLDFKSTLDNEEDIDIKEFKIIKIY